MDIKKVIADHKIWLSGKGIGRAGLQGKDMRGVNLQREDLRNAVMHHCILYKADMRYVDMRGVDLYKADMRYVDGRGADMRRADMRCVDLRLADMRGADMRGVYLRSALLHNADLSNTMLEGAQLPHFQICPQEGEFVAYKKVEDVVLRLRIPAWAKRTSSLVSRKCRASAVVVVDVIGGSDRQQFTSELGGVYVVGETTYPDSYDDDIRVHCTHGIHFFMTQKEAEEW